MMTPQGERYTQAKAVQLASEQHLIFICGHYEGVDERVRTHLATDEISIGDYVLTNGVLPAAVVIDAVVRLVPGVLGNSETIREESFMAGLLEYPQYTRPREFRGLDVPEVLVSGDHEEIGRWRREQAERRTKEKRPDLLKVREL
jgi:tRNA (guanine37-N1)-methyltransferase